MVQGQSRHSRGSVHALIPSPQPRNSCNKDCEKCNRGSTRCNTHSTRCNTHFTRCNTHFTRCNTHSTRCNTHFTRCNTRSTRCNTRSTRCNSFTITYLQRHKHAYIRARRSRHVFDVGCTRCNSAFFEFPTHRL